MKTVLALLLVVGVACSSSEPDKKTKVQNHIKKLVEKLCACEMFGCARAADSELSAYTRDKHPLSKPPLELRKRALECFNRVAPKDERVRDNSVYPVKIEAFAVEICACRDMPCAQAVNKNMTAWVTEHFKDGERKGTKLQVEAAKASQRKYADCYTKLLKAGVD